jgi:hypothetical protein
MKEACNSSFPITTTTTRAWKLKSIPRSATNVHQHFELIDEVPLTGPDEKLEGKVLLKLLWFSNDLASLPEETIEAFTRDTTDQGFSASSGWRSIPHALTRIFTQFFYETNTSGKDTPFSSGIDSSPHVSLSDIFRSDCR